MRPPTARADAAGAEVQAPPAVLSPAPPGGRRRLAVTFTVMGCTAHVVVTDGQRGHLAAAEERLRQLDALWTRFRPTSDVCRLAAAEGAPVAVAPETLVLLDEMVAAWRTTGGAYDPTLLPALVAAGDVASRLDPQARTTLPASARWPGDPGGIETDRAARTARLPRGTAVDAGGLGKGLAADMVAAELVAAGAAGALVSIGGDLRVTGDAPAGAWSVAVEDPRDPARALARLDLADGGVATSAPAARSWTTSDGVDRHHLLSPRTGEPADLGVASVTVAAATAAWAEALTKVAVTRDPVGGALALDDAGVAALVTDERGTAIATGAWSALARPAVGEAR